MFTFELQSGLGLMAARISPDGVILLDDPQIAEALDYDQAAIEFGYEESQLWKFRVAAEKQPIAALHEAVILSGSEFDFKQHTLYSIATTWKSSPLTKLDSAEDCVSSLLLLDYTEHVLLVYEKRHPRSRVYRRALTTIRKNIRAQLGGRYTQRHIDEAQKAGDIIWPHTNDFADKSVGHLMNFATGCWRDSGWGHNVLLIRRATDFIGIMCVIDSPGGYSGGGYDRYPEYIAGADAETGWQIRRFAAVMTAVRAGKRWPALGATK